MSFPELLILRHGETEWNREGRLQGGLDSALTETGRDQARRQGEILQEFRVDGWAGFSSPQGRAMQTAGIALADRPIAADPRLREIGLGDWSGQLRAELAAKSPHLFVGCGLGWYDHAPGGEGLIALEQRVAAFLAELDSPAVIVTHGITSRVIRCIAQGLPTKAFDTLGGGQGVVYHIRHQQSQMLA